MRLGLLRLSTSAVNSDIHYCSTWQQRIERRPFGDYDT